MTENQQNRFPDNQPYIGSIIVSRSQQDSSVRVMSASLLAERVQELEDQLSHIASALNEEGRQNQVWQEQILTENKRINELIAEKDEEICQLKQALSLADEERKLLKTNLFKQNQQMETVHRQSQQSRVHNSRVASAQLEQKILEMNDEVSTLLVKIQQLIEQNNQQLNYIQELKQAIDEYKAAHQLSTTQIQKLVDENNYLKEQIKQVEAMAISQHAESHDHYIQQLEQAKLQIEQFKGQTQQKSDRDHYSKEIQHVRAQVHTLEEELLQQREIERALKKKYQERLSLAQKQSESLSEQLSKARSKYRQLQHNCSQQNFMIEQLQKEKERYEMTKSNQTCNEEHFHRLIQGLQKEKEELKFKLVKIQRNVKSETSELYYSQIVELQATVELLRKQLGLSQDELAKSRYSVREISQLARRWQTDYRQLSRDYEEALQTRRTYQDRVIIQQAELTKHKEIYQKLVRRYDNFEGLYRELEQKVRMLQSRKENPYQRASSYSMESTDLIRLENSALRQELTQIKNQLNQRQDEISELKLRIVTSKQQTISLNEKLSAHQHNIQSSNSYEIQRFKARQRELERLVEALRNRLASESNQAQQGDQMKIKQLSQQLLRVNKALNQRQTEFDSLKMRYNDVQDQLSRMQNSNSSNKLKLQLSNLKTEYVALQRRLNENQMSFKKELLEKQYERESLIVENDHRRKKIEDLMIELQQERSSIDYSKLTLSLAQLKNKQLERELQHYQNKVNDLLQQRNSSYVRSRKNSESNHSQKGKELNNSDQKVIQKEIIKISTLNQSVNVRQNESVQVEISNHFDSIQKKNQSNSNVADKREWAEASQIYEQLMKEREAVRQIRNDFQKRWTSHTAQSHS